MQVWLYSSQFTPAINETWMETYHSSFSDGTELQFNHWSNSVRETSCFQGINKDPNCPGKRRAGDLFWNSWSWWNICRRTIEKQTKIDSWSWYKTGKRDPETTGIWDPLPERSGLGRSRWWRWSWNASTTYLKKSIHWIYHLFWYLESLYRDCRKRLCSSSRQSWWTTILGWKRKSYQWSGGILGISQAKTSVKRWNNQTETSTVSRWICLEIQLSQQFWKD